MNVRGICKKVLKGFFSEDNPYHYYKHNNKVFVTDGYHGFLIPDESFPFDLGKVSCKKNLLDDNTVKSMLDNEPASDAVLTEDVILTNAKCKTVRLRRLINVKNKNEVFINNDYLKHFDDDVTFKSTKRHNPVYVYEFGELVGIILPFVYNG